MTSFLTQGLDECGATICLAAFKLVSHVLDKGGYVRRVHKSANTPLSSVLTNTEGPWVEKGKNVDRHWDYSSTWRKGIENIRTKGAISRAYTASLSAAAAAALPQQPLSSPSPAPPATTPAPPHAHAHARSPTPSSMSTFCSGNRPRPRPYLRILAAGCVLGVVL